MNAKWVHNWKREYGVSFKKPCRKFKVSRAKALMRTKVTTLNMVRVRYAFKLLYGEHRLARGLSDQPVVYSSDQKGIHYNEAESKNAGTLALTGDEAVELKTHHAQSRARLSLFTMVSTDPTQQPPIEVLFKLKTNRKLVGMSLPPGLRMSLAFSPSGSYAEQQVLQYLQRWLPEWNAERQERRDFRVLLLDAYTAHKTEAVRLLARERGFLRVMYGGGVTGILQWNDTDLHARMEYALLQLEQLDFHKQLEERPWRVPTRERQDLVDDVGACWLSLPHASLGVQASKRTGLCVALPELDERGQFKEEAREDSMVTREAAEFWTENRIGRHRIAAMQQVRDAFAEGRLQDFWDIEPLLEDFVNGDDGAHVEGFEIDPPLDALQDDDARSQSSSEAEEDDDAKGPGGDDPGDLGGVVASSGGELAGPIAPAGEGESDFAMRIAATMSSYDSAIAMATNTMHDPQAANYLKMRRAQAWKMLRNVDTAEEKALSEFLQKDRENMYQLREKLRQDDQAKKDEADRKKRAEAEKKAAAEAKKAEAKRLERLVELSRSIPQAWDVNDFGQGCGVKVPPKAAGNIREVLTRMRVNSPPMPEDLEGQWQHFLDVAPEEFRLKWGPAVGHCFVKEMRRILDDMKIVPLDFYNFVRKILRERIGDLHI